MPLISTELALSKDPSSGGRTRLISAIGDRFKQCPDSEPEQAGIRIFIVTVVLVYLVNANLFQAWNDDPVAMFNLCFMLAVMIFSWLILGSIALKPKKSVTHRVMGMITDLGATSYRLIASGAVGSPLCIVYLWVTFGNGLRYGNWYLFLATVKKLT